ncbi:MAG TPA: zf-HC2 domain-containing protein, partial [Acidobacteriota bacterium]|nr:zf-HC2 domain-containing protein [Acidobacteriota bacterium]
MEITHEEARRLIQHNADEALNQNKQIMLRAHLKDCADCRVYAAELNEIENTFPLSMNVLPSKRKFKERTSIIVAIRTALVGIAIVVFNLSLWQIQLTNSETLGQAPLSILPVPTPSTQLTSTRTVSQNCEEIRYKVQENDTLESVADGFSTSKESI